MLIEGVIWTDYLISHCEVYHKRNEWICCFFSYRVCVYVFIQLLCHNQLENTVETLLSISFPIMLLRFNSTSSSAAAQEDGQGLFCRFNWSRECGGLVTAENSGLLASSWWRQRDLHHFIIFLENNISAFWKIERMDF